MVIRRYYGKQCNALNFLLFVSLRVTYRNSPVLEKQEEREREREFPAIAFRLPSKYSRRLDTDSNPLIFYLHHLASGATRQSVLTLVQAWITQSHGIIKGERSSLRRSASFSR